MLRLRPYQQECVDEIYKYLAATNENCLCVLPTATGKSVIIGEFCRRAISYDKHVKIIVATHSKELVAQNAAKLRALDKNLDVGMFSAGLGRKQRGRQITFAGIQSIWKHAESFPSTDILVIDEVHTVPKSETGTWKKFILGLTAKNPHLRVVGLSATPFRMTHGKIYGTGDDVLFKEICYEYDIIDAIEQGYICPITNRPTETHLTTDGVHKRGGEFIAGELERAVNIDELTQRCVTEFLIHAETRNCVLIFCSGVAHSEAVRDVLRARGQTCESLTGNTLKSEREDILRRFEAGEVKFVCNNNILTVGYDNPRIDMIVCLRPTGSAGLWVQILGRLMRLHPSKANGLVCDFTSNTVNFGPIDKIQGRDKRTSGQGEAPKKMCGVCFELNPASSRICVNCGTPFIVDDTPDLNRTASTAALLSNQIAVDRHAVTGVSYFRHKKEGKPDSLRVDYRCGALVFREWVCLEHHGGARKKAERWWNRRISGIVPGVIEEALAVKDSLKVPTAIHVRKNGKYDEIIGTDF